MNRCLRLGTTLTVTAVLSAPPRSLPGQEVPTAVVGVNVLAGVELRVIEGASIVFHGGRLACVDATEQCKAPPGARIIDGRGHWIIPGLIDFHTHSAELTEYSYGPLYLAFGVTAIRDVGGRTDSSLALRARWEHEPAPRLFISGHPLDGDPPRWPPMFPDVPWVVRNPAEAREAVRRARESGVDFIKLYGGLSPEALGAATEEAHRLGLKVTADIYYWDTPTDVAIGFGIDGLEHGVGELIRVPPRLRWARDSTRIRMILRKMVDGGVLLTPTNGGFEASGYDSLPTWKPTFQAMPQEMRDRSREWWAEADTTWLRDEREFYRDTWPGEMCRTLRELRQMGGQVAVGTDAFFFTNYPGDLHGELLWLTRCGFTPREAIAAATSVPAAWLGADSLGVLRAGAMADFLLLDGNPLEDVRNTSGISLVVSRGRVLKPEELLGLVTARD